MLSSSGGGAGPCGRYVLVTQRRAFLRNTGARPGVKLKGTQAPAGAGGRLEARAGMSRRTEEGTTMVAVRAVPSAASERGVYILAARDGSVRALVDPSITGAMPRLQHAVGIIGRVLQRCVVDQDIVVSVRFERGPGGEGCSLRLGA